MLDKVPNSYDKREESIIQTAVGPASYAFEEFYLTLNQVQRVSFVQTAVSQLHALYREQFRKSTVL